MKSQKMMLKTYCTYVRLVSVIMTVVLLFFSNLAVAQKDVEKQKKQANAYAAKAEKNMAENNFAEAEANYRRAIALDPENAEAKYNLGNIYYSKEKNTDATRRLKQSSEVAQNKSLKHKSYHNQGNAFMKQKKYDKAVEAYKNALRNDPTDDETRYNLALAKKMLEQQDQDGDGNDDDKNQDDKNEKDQGDNEDNKDKDSDNKDEKGDQNDEGDQGEDKQDQQQDPADNDQQDGDQQEQNQQQPDQKEDGKNNAEQQQQPVQGRMSPQQMKNLLEAMENHEKEVQDKINAQKVKGQKVPTEKDW